MNRISAILLLLIVSGALFGGQPRVAILSPAVGDAVLELGGAELLCGRSSACSQTELAAVPVVGDLGRPNFEALLRVRPDLLITDVMHPRGNWALLKRAGIRLERFSASSLADYPANLRRLGVLLGQGAAGERAALKFEAELARLRNSQPSKSEAIPVFPVFSVSPAVGCGRDSFITGILELAGARNITGGTPGSYFIVNPEFIVAHRPEYILYAGVPERAVREFFGRPEFQSLPAVRNNRFLAVDPDRFCRLNPRLPRLVEELRRTLRSTSQAVPATSP